MTERRFLAYKHRLDGESPSWHRQRTDSARPSRQVREVREVTEAEYDEPRKEAGRLNISWTAAQLG